MLRFGVGRPSAAFEPQDQREQHRANKKPTSFWDPVPVCGAKGTAKKGHHLSTRIRAGLVLPHVARTARNGQQDPLSIKTRTPQASPVFIPFGCSFKRLVSLLLGTKQPPPLFHKFLSLPSCTKGTSLPPKGCLTPGRPSCILMFTHDHLTWACNHDSARTNPCCSCIRY